MEALGFLEHEQVFAKACGSVHNPVWVSPLIQAKAQPEAIHAEPGYQPEAGYRLAGARKKKKGSEKKKAKKLGAKGATLAPRNKLRKK